MHARDAVYHIASASEHLHINNPPKKPRDEVIGNHRRVFDKHPGTTASWVLLILPLKKLLSAAIDRFRLESFRFDIIADRRKPIDSARRLHVFRYPS